MKQKYILSILPETQQLSIREYAELEKGEYAFICEEIHDAEVFRAAMTSGAKSLIPIIRRPNMYPRQDFGERIAEGIIDLLNDESGGTSREIFINDVDAFNAVDADLDPRVVYEDDDDKDDDDDDDDDGDLSDDTTGDAIQVEEDDTDEDD